MLPKRGRLNSAEVARVLKQGKSVRTQKAPHLSLKYLTHKASFRAAVIVSKSVVRGAVQRNRIRRAVYAALRSSSPQPHIESIFFVQKLPSPPLAPKLRVEVSELLGATH